MWGSKLPQQACEITVPGQCICEPFSLRNHVLASSGCLNRWDDSRVALQKIQWYKADSPFSLWSACLVTPFSRIVSFFSDVLHSAKRQSVWCSAVSLCLDRNLCIHWDGSDHSQGKYCIMGWGRRCNNKMGMPWLRGRRTRGMEWGIQVGNLRSPFQEWQRGSGFFLPTSLIKASQWGWSLWHQSLHTLVVLLNYSFLFLW